MCAYPAISSATLILTLLAPLFRSSVKQKSTKCNHTAKDTTKVESWEREYAAYCVEKEQKQTSETDRPENDAEANDSWETQYAAYCAEKEAMLQLKRDH